VKLVRIMRWLRLLALVAVLGATATSAGGCGSSDETESTASGVTTTSPEPDVLERLPEVPEATDSTSPPASSDGTGGSAFLREVFEDAQAMWGQEFQDAGAAYTPARLTIFHDQVHTACGTESANSGPFYCPGDHGVYLDTRFFGALGRAAGVELGDFAQAYVVAHELGHHVQTLLGVMQRVRAADEQDPAGVNARSVRLELQADCLAGIWAHSRYQRGQLTQADLDDALRAAAVVGSDFQQRQATGTVTPEDWTHGSSQQRQHWLTVGFEQGQPSACDTFGADR
jgi:predicted metalloprotease